MTILDSALNYHNRGCWVTLACDPTHPPDDCTVDRVCTNPGKIPIHARWQAERLSAETITKALTQVPTLNIGIRWGSETGLIDVETDSKAAEQTLQQLFDESPMPELTVIPTYRSRRGYHRIFKWTHGLPKAVVKLFGIEFRCGGNGRGAQSIVPPSIHPVTRKPYRWLEFISLAEVEPPPLPDYIIQLLQQSAQ